MWREGNASDRDPTPARIKHMDNGEPIMLGEEEYVSIAQSETLEGRYQNHTLLALRLKQDEDEVTHKDKHKDGDETNQAKDRNEDEDQYEQEDENEQKHETKGEDEDEDKASLYSCPEDSIRVRAWDKSDLTDKFTMIATNVTTIIQNARSSDCVQPVAALLECEGEEKNRPVVYHFFPYMHRLRSQQMTSSEYNQSYRDRASSRPDSVTRIKFRRRIYSPTMIFYSDSPLVSWKQTYHDHRG